MIRSLAAAAALATLALATFTPVGAASAQTYGQPVYLNAWGRPVGGTPLSEVETRSYVTTGRWADGYSGQAYVYVPAPVYRSYPPVYTGVNLGWGWSGGHRHGHWR